MGTHGSVFAAASLELFVGEGSLRPGDCEGFGFCWPQLHRLGGLAATGLLEGRGAGTANFGVTGDLDGAGQGLDRPGHRSSLLGERGTS